MDVIVVGDNKEEISLLLQEKQINIVDKDPEFVISYGGDGTFIRAENQFPGTPKIILRGGSLICKKCSSLENEEVLDRVKSGDFTIENLEKLKVEAKGKEMHATNDVIVHNADPRHAIRYKVSINGDANPNEVIGDGVVIATPFGSTGYYRSITDSFFELGIGIAFNNSTEQADHMVVSPDRKLNLDITRGPALVYADNQEEEIELDEGDNVAVSKSDQVIRVVNVNNH